LHLGVWEITSMYPYVTANSHQTDEVNRAMDFFLNLIKNLLAPKITNLLQFHCPIQYACQMQVSDLSQIFFKRPALDFGGAFFTVVVKEGSSKIVHIDFNDN
ncbi:hypothetical protein BJ912DRAFT_799205, partial [Pholiota molesta]